MLDGLAPPSVSESQPTSDAGNDAASQRTWAHAARAIAALFFILGTGFANWLSRIPSVRTRLGLGDQALGLFLLYGAAGALVSFRIATPLIKRFGSRRVAGFGTAAFCALLPAPAWAPTAALAAVGLFCLGLANGLMDVGLNSQAVELERRSGQPRLARFHGLFSLGGLTGAALGAGAAGLGLSAAVHLSLVAAVLLACTAYAAPALLAHLPKPLEAHLTRPTWALFALGCVGFCAALTEGAMADWIAVYMHDVLHTRLGVASLGYAAYSLAMVTGRFFGDGLSQRLGPRRTVMWGGCLMATGLATGLLINTAAALVLGVMAVGLGLSTLGPVVLRRGGELPDLDPSAAMSTLATLIYGGFLLGPPLIGLVAEQTTLRTALAGLVALALILAWGGSRVLPHRAAR